jgi:hypothetical protein
VTEESPYSEGFMLLPDLSGHGFTITCACGHWAELSWYDAYELRHFVAEHGCPPMPSSGAYVSGGAIVRSVGRRRR